MSTKAKDSVIPIAQVDINAEELKEAPMYSPQFLNAMEDYAFNTLHDYLVKAKIDPDALELFETLIHLQGIEALLKRESKVLYIWNNEASYCISVISKAVPKLGGCFISPSGEALGG